MGLAHSPKIVTDGLVLYLDAANNKSYPGSGTAWNDLSGNGRNGTLINGPVYNSSNNGNIIFDGSNDYGTVPYSSIFKLATDSTVNVWCKPSANSGNVICYAKGGWTGWLISPSSIVYCGSSTGPNDYSYGMSYSNLWQMITFVVDRTLSKYRTYRNGALLNEGNMTQSALTDTQPLVISARNVPDQFFNGTTTSISIYNRVLSVSEIQQNFNATRGRFGI